MCRRNDIIGGVKRYPDVQPDVHHRPEIALAAQRFGDGLAEGGRVAASVEVGSDHGGIGAGEDQFDRIIVIAMPLDLLAEVSFRRGRVRASSKAYLSTRSMPTRLMIVSWIAISRSAARQPRAPEVLRAPPRCRCRRRGSPRSCESSCIRPPHEEHLESHDGSPTRIPRWKRVASKITSSLAIFAAIETMAAHCGLC
jgi:hypothetical protein